MQKRFFVMRSIVGGGKSFQVKSLLEIFPTAVVCSADDHFHQPDGSYDFKPWELGIAHQKCQLKAFHAFIAGEAVVVLDNTNTQSWEYENYIEQAKFFGYSITVVEIKPRHLAEALLMIERNQHGVPQEVGIAMFDRWEDTPEGLEVLRPDSGIELIDG